jgi:hypothetical protein
MDDDEDIVVIAIRAAPAICPNDSWISARDTAITSGDVAAARATSSPRVRAVPAVVGASTSARSVVATVPPPARVPLTIGVLNS